MIMVIEINAEELRLLFNCINSSMFNMKNQLNSNKILPRYKPAIEKNIMELKSFETKLIEAANDSSNLKEESK